MKNPCIDPNYVTIEKAVLLNQVYELYEYDPIGYQFTHDPFTVVTKPISHTLCGDLVYTSTFMSQAINEVSTPLGYSAANLTHNLYTEDLVL